MRTAELQSRLRALGFDPGPTDGIYGELTFDAGKYPMTQTQWDILAGVVSELCQAYSIPVTPSTVLSHAEVQGTLGIAQSGKWDYTRLAFDLNVKGAKACGDKLRAAVKSAGVSPQVATTATASPEVIQ
jgi:peptidoglycan hydrolase-like protein with peptidoglycan-binding domain